MSQVVFSSIATPQRDYTESAIQLQRRKNPSRRGG